MKTNNNLDNSSDIRVVNLLTPRFTPTTSLSFKAPAPRRRTLWQAVRIGAVAAMVAVVVFIGISSVHTGTAREVVERAIAQLLESDNYLVQFTANVAENKNSQELYDGESYQRYQNGQLVLERPDRGIDLTQFATIDKLKEYAVLSGILLKFREEGDTILVGTRGDKVGIVARFSKSEGRLLGAECSGLYNGQQVTVLSVEQIDFDVPPTE